MIFLRKAVTRTAPVCRLPTGGRSRSICLETLPPASCTAPQLAGVLALHYNIAMSHSAPPLSPFGWGLLPRIACVAGVLLLLWGAVAWALVEVVA